MLIKILKETRPEQLKCYLNFVKELELAAQQA